jgi:uncharacterized protein (DUF1778 family)
VRGRITARVSQRVLERLELAAVISGATLNQFITQASLEKAERIVENERLLRLTEEDMTRFFDLLDNPPEPVAPLQKAFNDYRNRKANLSGNANTPFRSDTRP